MPAVVRYIGLNNGDWQNPSNWSSGAVPGRSDNVLLDQNVNVNYSGSSTGTDVLNITQTAGSLSITGGTLNVNAPSTFNGALRLSGPGAQLGIFGDPNDHSKPGQLTVNGTFTWDAGLLHGGTVTISNTATLNITGVFGEMDLGKAGEAETVLNNAGHMNQTGSANPNGNLVMDNAAINNQAGAVFTLSGDYDMHVVIAPLTSTPKLLTNSGIIRHGAGLGAAVFGVPINNLTGGLLDVQAGSVVFTGGGTGAGGTFNVNAGALIDLTGGQLPAYFGTYTATGQGHIIVASGMLTANGATFNFPPGMFQWTGGTIQGSGLTNAGFINLDNTLTHSNQVLAGNLYNNGTITLNDAPGTNFFLNRGTLYNQAGGLFDIQTDSNAVRLTPLPPFQLAIGVDNPNKDLITGIYNNGTFRKEGTSGTSTVNVLFNNSPSGVVDTRSGTLDLTGGGTSSGGTFNSAAGALMDFSFSIPLQQNQDPALFRGYQNMTGTYTGSGGGTVQLSSGRTGVQGADLILNFAPGLFQWTGGTLDSGVQNIFNQGEINVSAMSPLNPPPTLTGTLNNNGIFNVTGTVSLQLAGGVLNNQVSSGVIDFQSSAGIDVLSDSTGSINNYGTVQKTSGLVTNILAAYNNQPGGEIDAQAGTLNLSGGGNSLGGIFNAAAGGILDLTGGSSTNQFLSGTYTGSGDGVVRVSGGTLNAGNEAQLVFNFAAPTATNPLGIFQWQGGTINTGTRDLANFGSITITGPTASTLIGTINNTGTIMVAPRAPTLLLNNAFLNNLQGGTVDIQSDGGAFSAIGNSMVNNAGTFKKTAGASSGIDTVFNTPSGTVLAAAGTLAFNSPVTQGGTVLSGGLWEADNGAVLTINSAGNILFNNATVILSGPTAQFTNLTNLAVNNGTLILQQGAGFTAGSNFQNTGTLTLGPGSRFTVTGGGSFTQTASGVTNVQIGGRPASGQFGQIVASGQANLAGSINISLAPNFTPAAGDQYPIVSFASRTASFPNLNGLQAGRNVRFDVAPDTSTNITLVVKAAVVHTVMPLAFVIGLDNQAYGQKLDPATGQAVGGYFPIQAAPGFVTRVKAIAPGHDANNLPLLFAIGEDDQVYLQKFTAAGDQNGVWFLTQPGAVKSIVVGNDAANRPELFVIGLDNQVYALQFDANGNVRSGYFLTQPGAVKSLVVGHDAKYDPELFVIGLDNQVYAQKFDANGNSASGYFLTQPGQVKSIQAGSDGFLNPELFVIGLDDQVYALHFDANGNTAGGYFLTQAGAVKSLVVSHDANNDPELFVIGLDNQVYAQKLDANGNSAGGYFLANAGQVKSLDVGYYNGNDPEVFVTGLNDNLFSFTLDANGFPSSGYFLTQAGAILALRLTP